MAINRSADCVPVSLAEDHLARVASSGCSRHPYLLALLDSAGPDAARNLADAVHLLCSLHGRHPALIEIARRSAGTDGAGHDWLVHAAESFERERLYLVRLTAAVGPIPSTPGAAETEATLVAQRSALEVLASSERRGCSLGAAAALVGDWWAIRRLLDRASARVGLEPPLPSLPEESSVAATITASADNLASQRALSFGAEQLLLQHRALFDLLEARAEARDQI